MNKGLIALGLKLFAHTLNQEREKQQQETGVSDKDRALLTLKSKPGAVILILGRRDSGKTILSYRLASFLERPTYAVSPNQDPPNWITKISLEEIEGVSPGSTLILDDLPVYMSSRDYNEALVRSVERLIPITRHRGIILIFVSQTSGFADRWVMDADAIFLKQMSILYADIERPAVKKLMDRAAPHFEGRTDHWLKRHCYMITDTWEGLLEIRFEG